jgi:Arc/MetJ-type ribon-helix-helix transcriptional regulator
MCIEYTVITINTPKKKNTNITIDEDLLAWVDDNIKVKTFASRSHAVNYALLMLKTEPQIDEIDIEILNAMRGSRDAMETTTILSRLPRLGESHQLFNMGELQDRLKLMENIRLVKTYTKPGISGNGVYKAELIELGRQVLRKKGISVS